MLIEVVTPSALGTAMETISTDVLAYVNEALPIALGIAGTILAIRVGWRFFKSVTH